LSNDGATAPTSITSGTSATDLAIAMGIPAGAIVSAVVGITTTNTAQYGTSDQPIGTQFPTDGSTFALLLPSIMLLRATIFLPLLMAGAPLPIVMMMMI
jgi:hypothetical protein